ncbi:hypothetical protein C8Q73DRAFT_468720 [Cubamyces lactineus]|nr:hypothetical protein C8Q73DRAFT_468720 [Cubamyces lactineus]
MWHVEHSPAPPLPLSCRPSHPNYRACAHPPGRPSWNASGVREASDPEYVLREALGTRVGASTHVAIRSHRRDHSGCSTLSLPGPIPLSSLMTPRHGRCCSGHTPMSREAYRQRSIRTPTSNLARLTPPVSIYPDRRSVADGGGPHHSHPVASSSTSPSDGYFYLRLESVGARGGWGRRPREAACWGRWERSLWGVGEDVLVRGW